ncbi:hypothetical protein L207DRAFT_347741 [Hyaloscypha variabilis F]|uniref:Uncharacterized protein n=1 Tax=Hyaloscypha variabilis (strain UAMH 11265 / GT02V1 / F) TaxID=1149755 RepID=A0A2J6RR38_HYAVF|nr:hypothetical protein L207DRAFT_347741 [Hyaloscypha variabilis F]
MGLSYYECSRRRPKTRPYFVAAFPIDPQAKLYNPNLPTQFQYLSVKAYVDTAAGCNAVSSQFANSIGLPIRRYRQPKRIPVPGGFIISIGTTAAPFQYEGKQRWLSKHQVSRPRVGKPWLKLQRSWTPRRFWVDVAEYETPDTDSDSNDPEPDEPWLQFEDVRQPKEMLLEVIEDCPRPLILGAEFIHKFEIFAKRRFRVSPAGLPSESPRRRRSHHSGSSRHSRGSRSSRGSLGRGWLHNIIDRQRYRLGLIR